MSKACKSHEPDAITSRRVSGRRERNTLVTYPRDADNPPKGRLIRDTVPPVNGVIKAPALWEGPMFYQLVGGVMAHQGYDG